MPIPTASPARSSRLVALTVLSALLFTCTLALAQASDNTRPCYSINDEGEHTEYLYDPAGHLIALRRCPKDKKECSIKGPVYLRTSDPEGLYHYLRYQKATRPTDVPRFLELDGDWLHVFVMDKSSNKIRYEVWRGMDWAYYRYDYDAQGRLVDRILTGEVHPDDLKMGRDKSSRGSSYRYDAQGRLVHEENQDIAIVRTFDRRGNLVKEVWYPRYTHFPIQTPEAIDKGTKPVTTIQHKRPIHRKTWRYQGGTQLVQTRSWYRWGQDPMTSYENEQAPPGQVCRFFYDPDDKLRWKRQVCSRSDGLKIKIEVRYNDVGLLIFKRSSKDSAYDGPRSIVTERYRYNAHNLLVEKTITKGDLDPTQPNHFNYKVERFGWAYDERRRMTRATYRDRYSPPYDVRYSYACWDKSPLPQPEATTLGAGRNPQPSNP